MSNFQQPVVFSGRNLKAKYVPGWLLRMLVDDCRRDGNSHLRRYRQWIRNNTVYRVHAAYPVEKKGRRYVRCLIVFSRSAGKMEWVNVSPWDYERNIPYFHGKVNIAA